MSDTVNITIQVLDQVSATISTVGTQGPAGSDASATTDASLLTSGTLNDARLSGNVVLTSAMQAALSAKQATLVSGTNIKTVNGSTLLGSGDLVVSGGLGSSFTKSELNTAVSDGNVVFVGDALNGTLGATTPATIACTTITASGALTINSSSQHVVNNGSNQFFLQVTGSIVRLGSYNGTGLPLSINGSGGPVLIGTESSLSGIPRLGIVPESVAQTTLGLKGIASYTGTFFECRDSANGLKYKIDVSGNVTSGSIAIGSGTAILKVLSATATLDFGSVAADSYADLTITVTGAAVGDTVAIGFPNGSILADLVWSAWVSATNTVTIRVANNSSTTARDPASGTFRATVTQF